jgi:HAD superfamily hydrolase (TIGR01549 family)
VPVNTSAKAVLFDLDDTILDSLPARVRALEIVFSDAGIRGIDAKRFLFDLHGSSFDHSLARLAQQRNIKENLFYCYRRAYWFKLKGGGSLYPGVREMLQKLKSDGFRLGIVTNKSCEDEFEDRRIGCMIELERTDIAGFFSTMVGFEAVKEQKPSPEGINLALFDLGVKPEGALMVGDSPADIAAAKAAGCQSCQAVWGIEGEYQDHGADFIARTPADVHAILNHTA